MSTTRVETPGNSNMKYILIDKLHILNERLCFSQVYELRGQVVAAGRHWLLGVYNVHGMLGLWLHRI